MFDWLFAEERNGFEERISDLEWCVDTKQQRIEDLERLLKDKENQIETLLTNELESAIFEVNFEVMNAFSIERITREGKNETIIGYLRPNGDIGEWVLQCSITEHNRLVQKFVDYVENNK